MSRFKKFISFVLGCAMVFSVALTGCGTSNNKTAAPTAAPQSTAAAQEQLKPADLTWHVMINSVQPDQDKVVAELSKRVKEKINANVKVVFYNASDYEEKIKIVLASGDKADIVWTATWRNSYPANVGKNAFIPVDDLLKKYGSDLLKDIPANIWEACKIKGKIYAVPAYQISSTANIIWAKKDLAEKYKFDMSKVKLIKDIEPLLKMVKEGEPGMIPFDAYQTGSGRTYSAYSYGIEPLYNVNAPGAVNNRETLDKIKVFNQFETQEFKDTIKMARDWYLKGYIQKDILSVKSTTADHKAGKYAAYQGGNWWYDGQVSAQKKAADGYEVNANYLGEIMFMTPGPTATLNAITTSSKNPERAMMFLNLMDKDPSLFNLIAFGIENEHYTKTGENNIKYINGSKYKTESYYVFGNTFKGFVVDPAPADQNRRVLETHAKARPSPVLGFTFDTSPVLSEVAQIKAATDEFLPALLTGAVDPNEIYPKFMEKLVKAGVAKLLAEEQKQIDEFKASKK